MPLQLGLERNFFVGDEHYDLETSRIFSQNWLCVARIEELTLPTSGNESFLTRSVGSIDLMILRDQAGHVRAFHNVCRHRGTRLLDQPAGSLKNECITCPYHAWTYHLSGQLIGAPNVQDLDGFARENFGLLSVGCVNWCGFILVHLQKQAPEVAADFATNFAPILSRFDAWQMGQLRLGQTLDYRVAANWKLIFQNYNECYHCPTVHPALNRLTPYRTATNDLTAGPFLGGPMLLAEGFETVSTDGKRIGEPFRGLDEVQRRSVFYYTLFPSMFISAHPDYVMVHQLERLSRDLTRVRCHFLVASETSDQSLRRAVEQWDSVNREDWHVCELTQKGVQSPAYIPGPYTNLETMLIAFDRHYRSVMTD